MDDLLDPKTFPFGTAFSIWDPLPDPGYRSSYYQHVATFR